MLVAALRTDNPLGGAPLTYDDAIEVFALQGLGEVSAAKLLDLENRRQLVWADPVTREWALETAAIRVRKEAEAKAAARAAEAAAAAAASAAVSAAADRTTGAIIPAGASGTTLIFDPPAVGARRPAGVRAAATRFAVPESDRDAATVVWSEPAVENAASAEATGVAAGSVPEAVGLRDADDGAWAASVAGTSWVANRPPGGPPPGWQAPGGDTSAGVVTRRADRRSAVKEQEHRRAASAAWLRIVLYILIAVAMVVVMFVVQHGGF
jgi:hypothetical protein